MRAMCALSIAIALGGCGTGSQHDAHQAQMARMVDYAALDDSECQSYGAKPGTQSYIDCRMRMKEQRAALMAAERANQAQIEAARQQGTNAAAMAIG
jgi:hypothetical protein